MTRVTYRSASSLSYSRAFRRETPPGGKESEVEGNRRAYGGDEQRTEGTE